MVPARRMKGFASKAVEPVNVGVSRVVKQTATGDDIIMHKCLAIGHFNRPRFAVMLAAHNLLVEGNIFTNVIFIGNGLQILTNFSALWQACAPSVIWLILICVVMRRHITGNARICVDAPGAAQIRIFFIDAEICEAGFQKTHGDQYAGHAGTDNQNLRTFGRCHYSTSKIS